MDKKDILIVSWSFPPISSPRAYKAEAIVLTLIEFGHRVHLVTRGSDEDFSINLRESLASLTLIRPGEWPVFKVGRVHAPVLSRDWLTRKLNGALYKFFCYPTIVSMFVVRKAVRQLMQNHFDLCLSVDGPQPMHWAIAWEKSRSLKNVDFWIADCGDPLTRGLSGNMPARYFRLVENWFAGRADALTVPVTKGFAYFDSKFSGKIKVVKHALRFPTKVATRSTNKLSLQTRFAYVGNMAPYGDLPRRFFRVMQDRKKIEFHVFGPNSKILKEYAKIAPQLGRIIFDHGNLPREQLLNLISDFDFLVYFPSQQKYQVSFKLIDYSFAGLPVFCFEGREKDAVTFDQFLKEDFRGAIELVDYREYEASIACKKYLDISESKSKCA